MLYLNKDTEKQSETDFKTRQAEISSVGDEDFPSTRKKMQTS